jgi:hypothetical protein
MTDRELLEKAARAAGYKWRWYVAPVGQLFQIHDGFLWNYWGPLTDDGDALRLAVKLGFIVDAQGMHTRIKEAFSGDNLSVEAHNGDPYAATRRAIVRAAAAIEDAKNPPTP